MESREAYLTRLQSQIDEWHAEIDRLRSLPVPPERRTHFEHHIVDLQKRCEAAKAKITEIRTSQESGWERLRDGADQMWNGIKQLFAETKDAYEEGCQEPESSHSG